MTNYPRKGVSILSSSKSFVCFPKRPGWFWGIIIIIIIIIKVKRSH